MDSEKIKEGLRSPECEERLYAVQDIISFKLSSLIPEMIQLIYEEEDRLVRELAVEALKFFDLTDYFGLVAKFFESTDAFVRNCAIEIFGSKGEESVAFLTSIMDHENKEVRKLILDSLVATGSKYCIPALQAGLNDPAPNVKITAIEYLGRIEDKTSLESILKIFKDTQEPMLRISCIESFMNLGDTNTLDEVLLILGGTNMDSFFKPSIFRMISIHGEERHAGFIFEFFNNRNTLFLTELGNSLLKIIQRGGKVSIPEKTINFILSNLAEPSHSADERLTFMNLLVASKYDKLEEVLSELAGDNDINIVLPTLEQLAKVNLEKALKHIKVRIKIADSELAEALQNLYDMLSES